MTMKKFFKGFVCAFRGLIACAKEERNFRFHLAVAFHLFVYLPFFELTKGETCVIVMLCGAVLSLEAVNSAIERAVDCTGEYSPRAGAAKDMAAGAVLIAFAAIGRFFLREPWAIAVQLLAGAASVRLIFFPKSKA